MRDFGLATVDETQLDDLLAEVLEKQDAETAKKIGTDLEPVKLEAREAARIKVEDPQRENSLKHDDPLEYIEWKLGEDSVVSGIYHIDGDDHPMVAQRGLEGVFNYHLTFVGKDPYRTQEDDRTPRIDIYSLSVERETDRVYLEMIDAAKVFNEVLQGRGQRY